jgi:D-alanyl-D-alanine dipeptidase
LIAAGVNFLHSIKQHKDMRATKKMKIQHRCNNSQKGVILFILLLLASCSKNHEIVLTRNPTEQKFIDAGLVDIATIDDTIEVDLVNSDRGKNLFRQNFYSGLQKAYLQKEVALNLSKAQKILKSKHPDFSLLIMDAARPRSVSIEMSDRVKGTRLENFVADPGKGSMHNYGTAVDITIVDGSNKELDMGFSPFYRSKLRLTAQYMMHRGNRKLTGEQIKNRQLLTEVMTSAEFIPLSFEWWHFIGMPKDAARAKYDIIE